MVDDRGMRLGNLQREMIGDAVDVTDSLRYLDEPRGWSSIERGEVVAWRLECHIVGAVLPEHGSGGSVCEGHPKQGGQLARVRLLLPCNAAARHSGVDFLVPPATVVADAPRPIERERALRGLVCVLAGQ